MDFKPAPSPPFEPAIPHMANHSFPHEFPMKPLLVYRTLGLDRDTLRDTYNIRAADEISRERLVEVLKDQLKPRNRRNPGTLETAQSWLVALGESDLVSAGLDSNPQTAEPAPVQTRTAEFKPAPEKNAGSNLNPQSDKPAPRILNPQTRAAETKPAPEKTAGSNSNPQPEPAPKSRLTALIEANQIEFTALCVALVFQTEHSFMVAYRISQSDSDWVKVISALCGAIAIDAAAVMMTIHQKSSKNALKGFAVLQFLINMFYYRPWMRLWDAMDEWIGFTATSATFFAATTLMSAVLAFVVYSYSDIFTAKKAA
jgi:hypothetical protein